MTSTNPNSAGFAGAMDKMTSGLASGMQTREQAQLEKQTATMQMKQQQRSDDTGAWQEEMDRVKAQNKQLNGKIDKENMFQSLKYFTTDRNPRHLNSLLSMDIFKGSGIVRFSKIDPNADQALVAQAGLDMEDLSDTSPDGNGDSARYVKRIMQDGTEAIQDIYKVKQMSGYFKSLTDEATAAELALNESQAKVNKAKGKGDSLLDYGEWGKKAAVAEKLGVATAKDTVASLKKDMEVGNTGGQETIATQNRQLLDEKYGGSFITNFDPNDPKQKAEAYQYVRNIERFGKVELEPAARKDLKNIGKLIALGEPSSKLGEEETGLVDNFIFGLKKYWTDEGGDKSAAAFAAFRNVIRHTLYGSALTDSEITAFDAQLGTPNKKLGPLLKETAVALKEVKGQMDMLAALEDPYVVKYRMGVSMDQLEDIQDNLNKTITYLERKAQGKVAVNPNATPAERIMSYEDQI